MLVAAVGVVVATSSGGSKSSGDQLTGVAETRAMLDGIPQKGTQLGNADAPVVLTEYADLQCPFCRQYALNVLPQIVQDYVRAGKVRLDLKLLRFVGADSARGAQAALAAGKANRFWNFTDLFYRNQGTENSGYANDGFLKAIGSAAGVPTVLDAVNSSAHEAQIAADESAAATLGINSTPSFTIGAAGQPGRLLPVSKLDFNEFKTAIDKQLKAS